MSAVQLIVALVHGLLVCVQLCQAQGTAAVIHGSALAQTFSTGALPDGASQAFAPRKSGDAKRGVEVFDATLYKLKPDLTRYGLRSVSVVFKYMIWPAGDDGSVLPDRDLVRNVAVQVSKSTGIAVLDIEHWPLAGDPVVIAASIRNYETLIRWFKEAAPSVKVGYYGVAPLRNYWDSIKPIDSPQFVAWQRANDRVAPIARLADILFPSVYTFSEDQDGWSRYAIEQIQEARRYGGRKPIYVFLWQQYHPSNKNLAGTYLPPEYWRMELETARKYADGIVIWGGYTETWNEAAPWWLETKRFLQRSGSSRR